MAKMMRHHLPEYLIEAVGLAIFMISAAFFTVLFEEYWVVSSPLARRFFEGIAIGLTALGLIYSPWGKQSGAHFNPAVTLTFWRLGKVHHIDFVFYFIFQFIGGYVGVVLFDLFAQKPFRSAQVNFIITVPGKPGLLACFFSEMFISFILMLTILVATNIPKLARYTGLFAAIWIMLFITFEAPYSGMSMNPARSVATALPSGIWTAMWIYCIAPFAGMLLSVECYRLIRKDTSVICAKLHHLNPKRCIFKRCGYAPH